MFLKWKIKQLTSKDTMKRRSYCKKLALSQNFKKLTLLLLALSKSEITEEVRLDLMQSIAVFSGYYRYTRSNLYHLPSQDLELLNIADKLVEANKGLLSNENKIIFLDLALDTLYDSYERKFLSKWLM